MRQFQAFSRLFNNKGKEAFSVIFFVATKVRQKPRSCKQKQGYFCTFFQQIFISLNDRFFAVLCEKSLQRGHSKVLKMKRKSPASEGEQGEMMLI